MELAISAQSFIQAATSALKTTASESGSVTFIKMDKTGSWVFGSDDDEVEEGSCWAVDPRQFAKGFAAWGEGSLEGEEMATIEAPQIIKSALPDVGAAWKPQVGLQFRCLGGVNTGLTVKYSSTSKGAEKAWTGLLGLVLDRVQKGEQAVVPVVCLGSDSYKHKKFGKVYTPVLEVLDWVTIEGQAAEPVAEPEPVVEPEPAAKPRRRRTRAA